MTSSIGKGLRTSTSEVRPAVANMKARMQKAILEQFEFSAPNELWIFPRLSQDDAHAYSR